MLSPHKGFSVDVNQTFRAIGFFERRHPDSLVLHQAQWKTNDPAGVLALKLYDRIWDERHKGHFQPSTDNPQLSSDFQLACCRLEYFRDAPTEWASVGMKIADEYPEEVDALRLAVHGPLERRWITPEMEDRLRQKFQSMAGATAEKWKKRRN
jgi:hypothetical protein